MSCLLTFCAPALTVTRLVRIAVQNCFSTFWFSTFGQFGAVGTNQLYFAAWANGASFGLPLFTFASVVVFAMFPALAMIR